MYVYLLCNIFTVMRAIKYLLPLTFFVLAFIGFNSKGIFTTLPLLFGFGFMPLAELILPQAKKNLSVIEEDASKENKIYDWILYGFGLLQIVFLFYFFYCIKRDLIFIDNFSLVGRALSMGVLCGLFGINLSHELGHRKEWLGQTLAKLCLSTSLYYQFFIEHNKGHHKNFCTPHDPGTSLKGENIYAFYVRAIKGVYLGAWHIANAESIKQNGTKFTWRNEMIKAHVLEGLLILIAGILGLKVLVAFIIAALIGALLLESVNYIQHYGLIRKPTSETSYERGSPAHSWDSQHPIGRLMLFELTRHSDHHYLASRKFQILRSHEEALNMPTGYPGTILLALCPPLWFKVMHARLAVKGL